MQPQNHLYGLPETIGQIPPFILIRNTQHTECIQLHEVLYLEGSDKSTTFYVIDLLGDHSIKCPVSGINIGHYKWLNTKGFLRVNQSIMVNVRYLHKIFADNSIALRCNDKHFLITSTYRKEVKEQLTLLSCNEQNRNKEPDLQPPSIADSPR